MLTLTARVPTEMYLAVKAARDRQLTEAERALGVLNLKHLVRKRNEAHYDLVCALGFPVEYNTLFEPVELDYY